MSEHTNHLRVVPTPERRPTVLGVDAANIDAYWAWANLHHQDPDQIRRFDAAYCGAYKSVEDWALELVLSMEVAPKLTAAVPDWFQPYLSIDLAAIGRDFQNVGEIRVLDNPSGGIWVFDVRAAPALE